MDVRLQHADGNLISISAFDNDLWLPDHVFAPIEHEEKEIIGDMAEKERVLREARDKLDLQADEEDLKNLLNPKPKPAKKADDKDDDTEDADSDDGEDGGDDEDF